MKIIMLALWLVVTGVAAYSLPLPQVSEERIVIQSKDSAKARKAFAALKKAERDWKDVQGEVAQKYIGASGDCFIFSSDFTFISPRVTISGSDCPIQ